jgi:hypothetical protein
MATLEDFFPKKSFAPFILCIFGHHGVKFCPPKKHWFQSFAPFKLYIFGHHGVKFCPPKKTLVSIARSQEKEEGKVARLLYFASIGSQKYI